MTLGTGYISTRSLPLDPSAIAYGDEVFEKKSFIFSGTCRYMWFNLNWNRTIYEVNYASFHPRCSLLLIFSFTAVSSFAHKDH